MKKFLFIALLVFGVKVFAVDSTYVRADIMNGISLSTIMNGANLKLKGSDVYIIGGFGLHVKVDSLPATVGGATSVKQDSLKLLFILNNNKLDSLLAISRGSVVRGYHDTTSNGNDSYSLISSFSKFVWVTITADDSTEWSLDASYTAGTVHELDPAAGTRESYTFPIAIDPVTYPTIYYRRKLVTGAVGNPNIWIDPVGK